MGRFWEELGRLRRRSLRRDLMAQQPLEGDNTASLTIKCVCKWVSQIQKSFIQGAAIKKPAILESRDFYIPALPVLSHF